MYLVRSYNSLGKKWLKHATITTSPIVRLVVFPFLNFVLNQSTYYLLLGNVHPQGDALFFTSLFNSVFLHWVKSSPGCSTDGHLVGGTRRFGLTSDAPILLRSYLISSSVLCGGTSCQENLWEAEWQAGRFYYIPITTKSPFFYGWKVTIVELSS